MSNVGVIVHQDKVLGGGLEELRSALADVGHPDPAWYEVAKSKEAPKKIRKLVATMGSTGCSSGAATAPYAVASKP